MRGRLATYLALGPVNLARVGAYRLWLRTGRHPAQRRRAAPPEGPFFTDMGSAPAGALPRQSWRTDALYFGWLTSPLNGPPEWLSNAFAPETRMDGRRPWWRIPDFDPAVGDIKAVWEASRFDWLIAMAQRAASGEASELARLNAWLVDWLRVNPPYLGPNWKCGQEAAIRVMHLALAAMLLGKVEAAKPSLRDLVRLHLRRIAPTMAYALGQQNNHGTSEAAALFIGGSWLGDAEGRRWSRIGRRWLEDRARKLIEPDGTFSQYSTTYHRVMLDTYSLAEAWRRRLGLAPFSTKLTERLTAAVRWLFELVDPATGDAPNLGANDGARLIAMTDTDYRDFRPSVQLAAALLAGARAYPEAGAWDQPLLWLRLDLPPGHPLPAPASRSFDDGGLHMLRRGRVVAFLRYPRFRFRPSQADVLHLDLWVQGVNLLRDAGTFSYNVSETETAYFNGAPAHNLVEVDGRDQMPRISRFLFGDWLRARDIVKVHEDAGGLTASAGYRDAWGAVTHRQVWLTDDSLVCCDQVAGKASKAVLRWRLAPGDWRLEDGILSNGGIRIEVKASTPILRLHCVQGYESREYLNKTALPVLEVEVPAPCVLTTRMSF